MADSAVCSSSWLFSGLADPLWCTPSDMIASEKVLSLLPDQYGCVSPVQSSSPRCNPISSPGQHKGQATKAKLAQKGKCPRLSFTFNSNRIQCEKQQRLLLGGSVRWPLPGKQVLVPTMARSWIHVTWHARSHEDAGAVAVTMRRLVSPTAH